MLESFKRWSASLVGLLAAGPLVYALTARGGSPTGTLRVPGVLAQQPLLGVGRDALAVLIAGVVGLVAGRLVSLRTGLFTAGLALAWAAWGSGNIDSVVRATPPEQLKSALIWVGVEGAILGGLALLLGGMIVRTARPSGLVPVDADAPTSLHATQALAAGLVLSGAMAWLVAQNSLPGQALAAGLLAAVAATAATILIHHRLSPIAALTSAAMLAGIGPMIGLFAHGNDPAKLAQAVYSGSPFPTLRLLPMHWLAGAFLGIPLGISLGQWLAHHKFQPPQHPQPPHATTGAPATPAPPAPGHA
jgi:hypothetical protein